MFLELYVDWYMVLFYTVGTIFGLWVGRKMKTDETVENTIDYLIENRLVKWREDENGEIELLQIDENTSSR